MFLAIRWRLQEDLSSCHLDCVLIATRVTAHEPAGYPLVLSQVSFCPFCASSASRDSYLRACSLWMLWWGVVRVGSGLSLTSAKAGAIVGGELPRKQLTEALSQLVYTAILE